MAKPGENQTLVFKTPDQIRAEKKRGKGSKKQGRSRPDRFVIDLSSLTPTTDPSVIIKDARAGIDILTSIQSELRTLAHSESPQRGRLSFAAVKILSWMAVEIRWGGDRPQLRVYRVARGDEVALVDGEVCPVQSLTREEAALGAIDLAIVDLVALEKFSEWAQRLLLDKTHPERIIGQRPSMPPTGKSARTREILRPFFGPMLEHYLANGKALRDAVKMHEEEERRVTAALEAAKRPPAAGLQSEPPITADEAVVAVVNLDESDIADEAIVADFDLDEADEEAAARAAAYAQAAEADDGHAVIKAAEAETDRIVTETESSRLEAVQDEAEAIDEVSTES